MKPILKATVYLIILGIFSCRTTPENEKIDVDDILTGKSYIVKINLSGVEYENNMPEKEHISENNSCKLEGNHLITNDLQAKSAEVSIFDDAIFAKPTLPNGVKYVVEAFDINGKLADSKVCEVGKPLESLKLDGDEKYDIIIYSFNNHENPPTVSNINDELSYDFSDNTKEFLYHKISDYTATGGEKTINVTLKHKFSYAKFILNTKDLYTLNNEAVSISGIPKLLNVHHKSGKINIKDGSFSSNSFSDLYVNMRSTEKYLYESDYIPVVLGQGSTNGNFIAEIVAPTEYGDEKHTINIPVDVKSGTKSTYTLKLNGTTNVITHIRPHSMQVYTNDDCDNGATDCIKFPQGYNPDVWDSEKGFSIAKMKATNKWFPTTGFKGAEFDIIGSGTDQSNYRCRAVYGDWISLSGNANKDLGQNCHVTYNAFNKPNSHVTIVMEQKVNNNWKKIGDYTINIPNKWAIIRFGDLPYATSDWGGDTSFLFNFPYLDYCRSVGPRADNKKSGKSEAVYNEDDVFRKKYLYRPDELTNTPTANLKERAGMYFSRDIDITFMGEWGNLYDYKQSNVYLSSNLPFFIIWTSKTSDEHEHMFFVDYYGYISASWIPNRAVVICRGE